MKAKLPVSIGRLCRAVFSLLLLVTHPTRPCDADDPVSWERALELHGYETPIVSADFSPDNSELVVCARGNEATIWDLSKSTLVARLNGHQGGVTACRYSADGDKILTADMSGNVRTWSAVTKQLEWQAKGEAGLLYANFNTAGDMCVTAGSYPVMVWKIGETDRPLRVLGSDDHLALFALFLDDTNDVLTVGPFSACRWSVSTKEAKFCTDSLEKGELSGATPAAYISPDGKQVALAGRDEIELRRLDSGRLIWRRLIPGSRYVNIGWSPDAKRIVVASSAKGALVIDAGDGKALFTVDTEFAAVCATYSPAQESLAVMGKRRVVLCAAESGEVLQELSAGKKDVTLLSGVTPPLLFSPDGTLLLTSGTDPCVWRKEQ